MAALLENKSKLLFERSGLRVPRGVVVSTPDQVPDAAREIGFPAVVKALVPIGKKGKAGAVCFVEDEAALRAAAADLIGATVRGYRADAVLVEEKAEIARELFLSLTFDDLLCGPVLLIGSMGGVDVEEAVASNPEAFARVPLAMDQAADPDFFAAHWKGLGLTDAEAGKAGAATSAAWAMFRRWDIRILEINPLAIGADREITVVGALVDVDDEALFRQPELASWVEYGAGRVGRQPTALERHLLDLTAKEASSSMRFMEIPGGNVVVLLSGGGCSLWGADHIIDGGGRPATYYDATTPSDAMLSALFEGVLKMPGVRGLVFGSNIINLARIETRVRILTETLEKLNVDIEKFPVVLRMAGPGEEEARRTATRLPHLEYYGDEVTLEYALDRFLERVREVEARSAA